MINLSSVENYDQRRRITEIVLPQEQSVSDNTFRPERDVSLLIKRDMINFLQTVAAKKDTTKNYPSNLAKLYFNLKLLFPNEDWSITCPPSSIEWVADTLRGKDKHTVYFEALLLPTIFPSIDVSEKLTFLATARELDPETIKVTTVEEAAQYIVNLTNLLLAFPQKAEEFRASKVYYNYLIEFGSITRQQQYWELFTKAATLLLLIYDEQLPTSQTEWRNIMEWWQDEWRNNRGKIKFSEELRFLYMSTAQSISIQDGTFVITEKELPTTIPTSNQLPYRKEY